jgi:hypothetical protein
VTTPAPSPQPAPAGNITNPLAPASPPPRAEGEPTREALLAVLRDAVDLVEETLCRCRGEAVCSRCKVLASARHARGEG